MNLLKWKTINSQGQKIIYAEGCIYRHWEIHEKNKTSYSVKLPEGTPHAYGWEWYSYRHLQDAKDICEWWNREILLTKFTEEEKVVLNKFFALMDKIEEAQAEGW
jgi:hypothetical protein